MNEIDYIFKPFFCNDLLFLVIVCGDQIIFYFTIQFSFKCFFPLAATSERICWI